MSITPITVLVVEDEADLQELISMELEDAGYTVLCASDGLEALNTLEKHASDIQLILLDQMMPNMSGIEVLHTIKKSPHYSQIPVIIQSAIHDKSKIIEGIDAGAYYYLTKPYSEDLMLSIVKAAIDEYQYYQTSREEAQRFQQFLGMVEEIHMSLQTLQQAHDATTLLASMFPEPERVITGISELLINAIEHGNLEISYDDKTRLLLEDQWSGEVERRLAIDEYKNRNVTILFKRSETHYEICIQDEGSGFDWKEYLEFSPERATDPHGRGIAMSKMMSFDEMEYVGNGNCVIGKILRKP